VTYNTEQKRVGFGPPGKFFDYAIIIDSQQPCGNKIEIELIIDDRLRSHLVTYRTKTSSKRTVKLTDYDRDRALKYAVLSLPATAKEVIIECLSEKGPIPEQTCIYDLYTCSFSSYSDGSTNHHHGVKTDKGVSVNYGGTEYKDAYQRKKTIEKDRDKGFFNRIVSFIGTSTFLIARCYLGAVIAKNLGFKGLEQLLIGAVIGGIISEHALGSTVSNLFGSSLIKAALIFSPVCLAAYFAVNPSTFEIVLNKGLDGNLNYIFDFFTSLTWRTKNIEAATLWATAGLLLIGIVPSMFFSDKSDKTKNQEDE